MSDILPCEGRDENKTVCVTPPFPVNETCVFEFGVCNSVKEDPETGQPCIRSNNSCRPKNYIR